VKFLLLFLLFFMPLLAWSASFDCQKARSITEKMVCSDPELSKLDEQLAQAYRDALQALPAPRDKEALIREQKNWVIYVHNICEDTACLHESYQTRIKLLERHESPSSSLYPTSFITANVLGVPQSLAIIYLRDPNQNISIFTHALLQNGISGKIIGCNKLINLTPGYGNPDAYTVAASCALKNKSKRALIQICYDNMGGEDAPSVAILNKINISYQILIDFAVKQCIQNN
jgi:uncharacterized protein